MSQRQAVRLVGQQLQEGADIRRIELFSLVELPVDGSELRAQLRYSLAYERSDRIARAREYVADRAEPGSFEGEHEVVGRLVAPLSPGVRFEGGIEGAVDLDRRDCSRGELQLAARRHAGRIERAAPRLVGPTSDPNPNPSPHSRLYLGRSSFAVAPIRADHAVEYRTGHARSD